MQSRIGWWIAAGLLTLSVGCGNVDGLIDAAKSTLDGNRSGDQECQNYLSGIKTAQIAYDAAFDTYVECSPWPDEEPGKELRTWEDGSAFDTLGWHPDADVLGTYSVEIDDHAALDFTARCVHDADEDGEQSVWEASKASSPKQVSGPKSGSDSRSVTHPDHDTPPTDTGDSEEAETEAPKHRGGAESPRTGCLSDDAPSVALVNDSVPDAINKLESVDGSELWVHLTQAQLCNEEVQDALSDGRRNLALELHEVAFNGRALGACLEPIARKVCAIMLPSNANDDALASVAGLDELTNLIASGTQITNGGLAYLASSDGLHHLDLSETDIGDAGLAYLAGLTELTVLNLDDSDVTPSGLTQLAGIEGLKNDGPEKADEDEDGADEDTSGGFLSALFSKLAAVFSSESDADNDEDDDDTGLASAPAKNPDAGEGAMAKREEGKVGKKEAKMERARSSEFERNQPRTNPIKKGRTDKEIAKDAGVLGALNDSSGVDGIVGSSSLGSTIVGGIGATTPQIGAGGLGSRGSGVGGSGRAEGLAGLGTKGRGSSRSGYGEGSGKFGARSQGGIAQIGGDPIILGALSKSLIDAVIKRHMSQIKYCYLRELGKDPSLGGKLVVKFVVSPSGSVSSATTKSSTLGSRALESCINGRFMRFKFPEPKGGGIVIVSYPFIFAPD